MDPQQDKGSPSTFGRSLMSYIGSKLPYSGLSVLDNINEINPKYKHFNKAGTQRDVTLAKHSISQSTLNNDHPLGNVAIDKHYQQFMYANVDYDKGKRLRDYRTMAAFAEVGDALDEICDEIINVDENDECISLKFKDSDNINNVQETELKKEFLKFVGHFKLEDKGWSYFRRLLVEGELFFEHIIHSDHPDAGILGVVEVPTDLIDPIYDNVQNMITRGYLLRKPIVNQKTKQVEKIDYVPFDKNQITYIHSNIWNEDMTMRVPFLENARRAYRQLSLIEDAIVIYRLVRAPEKLVFNVDVGNMPPPKAEAYLKKLMHNYWSRRTYDGNKGGKMTNAFNPQSMLDSFWFAKRAGSEGTNVTQLQGGQNLGELTDLNYFVKKLYKSLRVPTSRLEMETTYEDSATILREELRFARFLIRLQKQFAAGLKTTFITHLKLKKMWNNYNLKEHLFDIEFKPPSSFYTYREQQVFEIKSNNFTNMSNNEQVSNTYAQKKYLGWSDLEIKQNREWLKKDAALQFELANIGASGPNWRDALAEPQEAEPAAGGGGFGGGGMGMPPAGGPADTLDTGGEAAVEADPGAETPEPQQVSQTPSALPS